MSRRALLGLGLRRAVEGRLDELAEAADAARAEAAAASQAEGRGAGGGGAAARERARARWEGGDRGPLARLVEPAAEALAAACDIGPGESVLDACAGDGSFALAAARRGARVIACDFSEAALEQGRARTRAAAEALRAAGGTVEWRLADVERLPLDDASFDCAGSSFGVIHALDPRSASAELDRVARPGGRIGLTAWPPAGPVGRVLMRAAGLLDRPEARAAARWGRFEDAYRRFGFHAEFELRDGSLPLGGLDEAGLAELLLDAPGPMAGATAEQRELLAAELSPLGSELDYVIMLARKGR